MPNYRAPGVYIDENTGNPPSVTDVPTAIPVFIGYTAMAQMDLENDLILKPTQINSMYEFEQFFGGPQVEQLGIHPTHEGDGHFTQASLAEPNLSYFLYHAMQMFFANGGGKCYVVSVGLYQEAPGIYLVGGGDASPMESRYGLYDGLVAAEMEDEPTLIVIPEAVKLTSAEYQTLMQAALEQCHKLQDRMVIIDVYDGDKSLTDAELQTNRELWGDSYLSYGAAYYPFIKTTLHHPSAADEYLVLPPSSAVAGVYAASDRNHGVWKAPANVSLASVIEPRVTIDKAAQARLNIDPTTGKSINAIRAFAGKGTLIWGARTLAGNDNEWRYVSVRRFSNLLEESIKKSSQWVVFEPNEAATWVRLRGMIENYLVQKWREGALMGTSIQQAFFVRCGLGATMTAQDILEGRINLEMGVALLRPAEFRLIRISYRLQTP